MHRLRLVPRQPKNRPLHRLKLPCSWYPDVHHDCVLTCCSWESTLGDSPLRAAWEAGYLKREIREVDETLNNFLTFVPSTPLFVEAVPVLRPILIEHCARLVWRYLACFWRAMMTKRHCLTIEGNDRVTYARSASYRSDQVDPPPSIRFSMQPYSVAQGT